MVVAAGVVVVAAGVVVVAAVCTESRENIGKHRLAAKKRNMIDQ